MPRSMTGFARLEQQQPWGQLICEIRSVNHRYLEPSIRMPDLLRRLELPLRDQLRNHLSRGKVEASIFIKWDESANQAVNLDAARNLIDLAQSLSQHILHAAPINALEVLRWPGVLQTPALDQDALDAAVMTLFARALTDLQANRSREGTELAQLIEQRLVLIQNGVNQLKIHLPKLQQLQQEKLKAKLDALAVEIDRERLAQELVYLAQKSDVAEELDRLETHIIEVRHCLKQKDPVGRKLDFLMQELNREANTLSSKSNASETTQIAVDLKVLIEQMREQVQNIE
ncbi:MAG TPA: YicC/YloC family endoribonuclease [Cellvibrionaceae bacterium]